MDGARVVRGRVGGRVLIAVVLGGVGWKGDTPGVRERVGWKVAISGLVLILEGEEFFFFLGIRMSVDVGPLLHL